MQAQVIDNRAKIKAGKHKSTDLWYQRYPARFRKATSHLPYDLRCQYSDLLDLFYDHGGPLPDDDKWIACALFCDVRKWKLIRKALIAHHMLFIGNDGLLHQSTVDKVLRERADKFAKRDSQARKHRLGKSQLPPSTPRSTPPSTPRSTPDHLSRKPNLLNVNSPEKVLYARALQTVDVREELSRKKTSVGSSGRVAGLRVVNGGHA